MHNAHSLATRWLGVGLSAALAVTTIVLAATGQLSLYINPSSTWFAVGMSVLLLVGAAASFALPLGAEDDHGHDHADAGHDHAASPGAGRGESVRAVPRAAAGAVARGVGGVVATAVVVAIVALPAASLSTELALARDVGAAPLFGGEEVVSLATAGDTESFEVGDWASVFATATNPDAFTGTDVSLVGFATPADDGGYRLTRLVITHCVIDAQTASVPIEAAGPAPETGQWVEVTGTVTAGADGALRIEASNVTTIDEPDDPYEY